MVSCDAGMSATRGQVIINNRNVSYLRWGDGLRHIVLLHGITSSARSWWRVAPVLANLDFTVTAFDMPGHGESSTLTTHDIASLAQHIAPTCDTLGISVHTLIGHSWGGAVSIAAASLIRPQQLALIDPLVALDTDWGAQVVARFSEGIGQAVHQTTPWLSARNKLWHRCDVYWKAEALQQCRHEAVDGLFLHSGSWDLVGALIALPAPTLCLVASAESTVINLSHQQLLATRLQQNGGQFLQIGGTDHNMHRAGFDLTMPAILSWIKQERAWTA